MEKDGGPTDRDGGMSRCAVDCDCPQGQACAGGRCVIGIVPVYCCDSPGCPEGEACTDSRGNDGRCPAETECAEAGGTCVGMFEMCPRGTSVDSTLDCGGVRSLRCCRPRLTPGG